MIFIPGEFSSWTLIGTFIGGWTIGSIAAILGSVLGGVAAAGGTAHLIKSLTEGNLPWEDPEAFLLGQLKAGVGGIGEIVRDIGGQDTLQEQLKGLERSNTQGTGVVAPGSTGQGIAQISAEMKGQQAERPMGAARFGGGGPGWQAQDAADAGGDTPSRGDILKGAAKDVGIGGGIMAASFAAPYIGAALGPAAGAASTAGQFANVTAGASSTAPALGTFGNVVSGVGSTAASVAPEGIAGALGTAREGISEAIGAARDFIQGTPVMQAARALPSYIGDTATGVLQHGAFGGIKGALTSLINDEDPGRGALIGAASGGVTGGAGGALSSYMPSAGSYSQNFSPVDAPTMSSFDPSLITPSQNMNLGGFAARSAPRALGGIAGSLVSAATAPTPPMPPEPPYASGRRPYWMNM